MGDGRAHDHDPGLHALLQRAKNSGAPVRRSWEQTYRKYEKRRAMAPPVEMRPRAQWLMSIQDKIEARTGRLTEPVWNPLDHRWERNTDMIALAHDDTPLPPCPRCGEQTEILRYRVVEPTKEPSHDFFAYQCLTCAKNYTEKDLKGDG